MLGLFIWHVLLELKYIFKIIFFLTNRVLNSPLPVRYLVPVVNRLLPAGPSNCDSARPIFYIIRRYE